jgi:hypothetical protein
MLPPRISVLHSHIEMIAAATRTLGFNAHHIRFTTESGRWHKKKQKHGNHEMKFHQISPGKG